MPITYWGIGFCIYLSSRKIEVPCGLWSHAMTLSVFLEIVCHSVVNSDLVGFGTFFKWSDPDPKNHSDFSYLNFL